MKAISVNNLARAIYESSKKKDGADLNHALVNAAEFIRDKNMMGKSDLILASLEKIIDEDEGIARVKVSSSKKLTKGMIEEIEELIKKRYKKSEVIMEEIEDSKLLGGIRIEIGDEVIDMTLKNYIRQLQNYLNEN